MRDLLRKFFLYPDLSVKILRVPLLVSENGSLFAKEIPFNGRRSPSPEPVFFSDNVGLSLASEQQTANTST
jgi:hypothetical protein